MNGKATSFNKVSFFMSLNAKMSQQGFWACGVRPCSVSASNNVRRVIVSRRLSERPMRTRNTQAHTETQAQEGGVEEGVEEGEALESVLDAMGSGNERSVGDGLGGGIGGDDDDPDSGLDLYTPLLCVLFFFLRNLKFDNTNCTTYTLFTPI